MSLPRFPAPAESDARRRQSDPLRDLLSFHGAIRSALDAMDGLAAAVARGDGLPFQSFALYDFFIGPLAWHDVDEEASLLPRLRKAEHPARLQRLLETCAVTHAELQDRLAKVLPHLRATSLERAPPDHALLQRTAVDLRALLEPHLRLEELEIYPLARLILTEADLEEMAREMSARHMRRSFVATPVRTTTGAR